VAAICERLAEVLRCTAVTVSGLRQLCGGNAGRAAEAINHTLDLLQREHQITAGNLDQSVQTMRRLADEMDEAQRRHHFSLLGMVKAGGLIVATGAVVWVTLGTATPAAVAVVEAELAVAEAAAAAATAASESAAAECSLLTRAFASVRGLASFSRAQLAYGEVWMGVQSVRSEALDNRLLPSASPRALALDAAGFFTGAGAGKLATLALAGRTGLITTAAAATAASALGGAAPETADDWQRTGSFPARSFMWNAAKGASSSVISGSGKKLIKNVDAWKAKHRPRPPAGRHRRPSGG
jgi:hypothetical protein